MKNPYLNGAAATGYIGLVSLLFQLLQFFGANKPDNTVLAPVLALSFLVFSVALMAYLFFYRPVSLLLENKKEEAVTFFLKTLATFGVITIGVFLLVVLI